MNRTGCPEGLATDEILFYDGTPLRCDMSSGVWVFYGATVCSLKFVVAVGHTYMWRRRQQSQRTRAMAGGGAAKGPHGNTRFPIVPTISWVFFLVMVLLFALTSENVANTTNGGASFLLGLGWTLFGILMIFYLFKFVSLGHRIIPSRARAGEPGATDKSLASSSSTSDALARLARFSNTGKVLVGLLTVALLGQMLSYCVAALLLPDEYAVIRVANGFQAWFLFQLEVSLVHHIERIKAAIRANASAVGSSASPTARAELRNVVNRLIQQEVILSVAICPMAVFHICIAAGGVYTRYYIFTIPVWFDAVAGFLVMLSNLRMFLQSRAKARRHNDRSGGGDSSSATNVRSGKVRNAEEAIVPAGVTSQLSSTA